MKNMPIQCAVIALLLFCGLTNASFAQTPRCDSSYSFIKTDNAKTAILAGPGYNLSELYDGTVGFTWEAWVYLKDTTYYNTTLISVEDAVLYEDIFLVMGWTGAGSRSKLTFLLSSNVVGWTVSVQGSTRLMPLRWYYVSAVCDYTANTISLFLDGTNIGTTPIPFPVANRLTRNITTSFGNVNSSNTYSFDGYLDEVKFWKGVRTSADMLSDSAGCATMPLPNLVAYFKAKEGSGSFTASEVNTGFTGNNTAHWATNAPTRLCPEQFATITSASAVTLCGPSDSVIITITVSGLQPGAPWSVTLSNGTTISGVADASGNGTGTCKVLPSVTTSYTIVSLAGKPCAALSGTMTITVSTAPAPITGNAPLCTGSTIVLGNATAGGSWSIAPVSVATISSTGTVTGIAGGTAIATYTTACGPLSVVVTVTPTPGPITGNMPLCTGNTMTLANAAAGGTWSIAPAAVATITATGDVTALTHGTAIVTYSTSCGSVTEVVSVTPGPGPITGNAIICPGKSVALGDSVAGGTWSITPLTVAFVTPKGVVLGIASGTATVTYATSCGFVTAIVSVDVFPHSVLTDVSTDQTIKLGSSIQLNALGAELYVWTPNDGSLDNHNINNPIATPTVTTTYTVVGTTNRVCNDTATVTIRVDDDMSEFIPLGFTPNGDGKNDIFRIRKTGIQKLIEFAIYNRYGERVYYNGTSIDAGWDGTYKGVPCDPGSYFYQVILGLPDGTRRILKGDVTLIR